MQDHNFKSNITLFTLLYKVHHFAMQVEPGIIADWLKQTGEINILFLSPRLCFEIQVLQGLVLTVLLIIGYWTCP